MILVYVVCKDKKEADTIGKSLVKKKLVACANIFPVGSFYYWNEKLVEDNEFVLLLKTLPETYDILKKEIKKLHSYDLPAIIKINAEANGEYEKWIKKNTKS